MEILGVGGWELVAILVIALVVAGPTRMIRWAYLLGQFFAKLRVLWTQAATTLQKEFDEAGVDIQVPKDVPTRQTIRRDITNMVNPLLKDVREPLDEFTEEVRRSRSEVRGAVSSLKSLNGSGSMSDPMGTGAKPAKFAQPSTPMPSIPPELGVWNSQPAQATEPATTLQDLGTWGQTSTIAGEDAQSEKETQ